MCSQTMLGFESQRTPCSFLLLLGIEPRSSELAPSYTLSILPSLKIVNTIKHCLIWQDKTSFQIRIWRWVGREVGKDVGGVREGGRIWSRFITWNSQKNLKNKFLQKHFEKKVFVLKKHTFSFCLQCKQKITHVLLEIQHQFISLSHQRSSICLPRQ